MSTKELIQQEIDKLSESQLPALYELVKRFAKPKVERPPAAETFMDRLKKIQISAPPDFSENHEQYASGVKSFDDVR